MNMDMKLLLLVLVLIFAKGSTSDPLKRKLENDERDLYRVIWNSRVERCGKKYKLPIDLEQWGIEENIHGSGWHGDLITLLGGKYGSWPYISPGGYFQKGGVAFRANFTQHFLTETTNLKKDLPVDWHGFGVFDIESYRPLFKQNFGAYRRYKDYSYKLIKQDHPDWPMQQIKDEAERQWNEASKKLWGGTLLTARSILKNNQGFGYYHFPQCFGYNFKTNMCNTAEANNEMRWLWQSSSALFPSIYFYHSQPNVTRRREYVYGNIVESIRCREYAGKPHMPIYPYSKYNVRLHPTTLYTMVDLINSIGQVADLGAEGIVLWGDNWSQTNRSRCQETKNYMDHLLGPYVAAVKQFVQKCSAALCSKNGRCYTTDPSRALDETIFNTAVTMLKSKFVLSIFSTEEPQAKNDMKIMALSYVGRVATNQFNAKHTDKFLTADLYQCRCVEGYSGDKCQNKV